MSRESKILEFFQFKKSEFKPYYQEENSFGRLAVIHSVAAFIIAPIYSVLIYSTDVPAIYFYLGVSYTVLFPFYLLICRFVRYFRDKLIYFFIVHLFGMTLFAYNSLLQSQFEQVELFCFYALYSVTILVMQRWYPALLYNFFILSLVIYGLQTVDIVGIAKPLIFGIFVVLVLSSTIVLYARQRMLKNVEEYSQYLKRIMNNPGLGYMLLDLRTNSPLVDYNAEAAKLLNVKHANREAVQDKFLAYLGEEELNVIRELKVGRKRIKTIDYTKFNRKVYIEMSVNILSFNSGFYWLCRIADVTEEVEKREEIELNEKKYRNLYYKNRAGVFTLDQNARITNGNNAFFDMFEGTVKIGSQLFVKDQLSEWSFILDALGAKESIQNYQTQFELENGSSKTFIFSWYYDKQTDNIEGSVIDLTTIQKASQALKQSEEKYRLIYEESNDVIFLLDNDKIIDVNRRAIQLFGIPERELLGKNFFELSWSTDEESHKTYQDYRQRLRNLRSTKFDWLFDGNGKMVEAQVSLIEIILGDRLFYQCVIHDNTELNKNIREIEQNRRNMENILESNPQAIFIVHEDKILYTNSEVKNLIGSKVSLNKLFTSADQVRFNESFEQHLEKGKRVTTQLELKGKSGQIVPVDVSIAKTTYEDHFATMIILNDVSVQNTLAKEKLRAELAEETNKKLADEIMERIKAEKLLQEEFLRTKAILDSSSNTFLLTLGLDHRITSFNTHLEKYAHQHFGNKIKEGTTFDSYFESIFSQARLRVFRKILRKVVQGESHQFEVLLTQDNKEIWWEIFMNPIFDTEGTVAEISLVAHDVSEKKEADFEIVESLKEKEILLKEIHHRVKNNLQVISSILNLQSSFVTDDNTLGILQESRNRIRSMAIIHENLYRTEDFSSINFATYLQNLTANLVASYRITEGVSLNSSLDNIDLILDQAIPCGLLVNELITNSLKYAWKDGERGTITLDLKQKGKIVTLIVADDGVGLPMKFEEMNSDTLGLQLVITLVEQLEGEVQVDTQKGTKYLIKFENIKSQSE